MKNTDECATISIVNLQTSDGKMSKTEFFADCEFFEKDGARHIVYTETADVGTGGAKVFLKIQKNNVTMRRMGEFKSVMRYETGKITDAEYRTPYGKIDLKLDTKSIDADFSEKGGQAVIKYTLTVGNEDIESELHLEIKGE